MLGLGLAVAADVVVRRLGREARRVPLAHRRECAGQVEAEALLGGEAGREAVLRLRDLVELALRGELRRRDLGRRRDEGGRGRDGEGEGELGEGHCCELSAGGGAGQVSCNVAPDTRAAAVERRAAAQRATLRNARACTARCYARRASARRHAPRELAAADA